MIKEKRKRICRFCEENVVHIDYKNDKMLTKFTTEQGKMIPRRTSGVCAKHQRMLTNAIKRARIVALMPFVDNTAR
jgi:small subunit ribosomal protein S18